MKKIKICENLGFCHGVRDAIWASILSSKKENKVFVLGSLIHNERILEELSLSRVKFINEVKELPFGAKVIIPAHGITKDVFIDLKNRTDDITDMTCPVVVRLRNCIINFSNLGYFILLLGRKDHSEIVGVASYIKKDQLFVIEDINEIKAREEIIKSKNHIVFLSQTTANYENYNEIANYLKSLNLKDLVLQNTICPTVINRQTNTLNLSKKVELMLVIGDKKSSNTLSSFDISSKNTYSILLESNKPLTDFADIEEKLKSVNTIGITAGTSTPYYVIEEFSEVVKKQLSNTHLKSVIVIFGPTACGKTEISEKIAMYLNCEIVSCDSMQIYKELQIGTAKPNVTERDVPYHLLDFLSLSARFSVADYRKIANNCIHEILNRKKTLLIVGGSYLYLSSIIDGLFEVDRSFDIDVRKKLFERADKEGLDTLYDELLRIDPETASKIGKNDLKRIIRALEVYELTGEKISLLRKEHTFPLPFFFIKIGLLRSVDELYERINKRVDKMIESGLVEEIKKLINDGFKDDLVRIKPHGYREIASYLKGEVNLEEAIELMKKNTRNYAKRQLSWLRQRSDFHLLNLSANSSEESIESIYKIIETVNRMII